MAPVTGSAVSRKAKIIVAIADVDGRSPVADRLLTL